MQFRAGLTQLDTDCDQDYYDNDDSEEEEHDAHVS